MKTYLSIVLFTLIAFSIWGQNPSHHLGVRLLTPDGFALYPSFSSFKLSVSVMASESLDSAVAETVLACDEMGNQSYSSVGQGYNMGIYWSNSDSVFYIYTKEGAVRHRISIYYPISKSFSTFKISCPFTGSKFLELPYSIGYNTKGHNYCISISHVGNSPNSVTLNAPISDYSTFSEQRFINLTPSDWTSKICNR